MVKLTEELNELLKNRVSNFTDTHFKSLVQCFSTFLLQRNLSQMFALLMEPYATVKQWYCYNRVELWLQISSQAISVCFGATPVEKHCFGVLL